ncbi:MAG: NUDIX domain-containing protein [Leptospiraceae bacterium]|nr:NUDIX domain-containing protein [Leptospiraceae bacterium]
MKTLEESFGIIPLRIENGKWQILLVLNRGGRHWVFPKGHSNPGEKALETAFRELKEETGLEVQELLDETPLTEKYQFHRQNKIIVKTVQYFPALVQGNLKIQVEEIQDAKWVALEEAIYHVTFKEAKRMCQKLSQKFNS